MMLFLDTGIRLDELVNLETFPVDFAVGEMTVSAKVTRSALSLSGCRQRRPCLITPPKSG
jgi:hypothetical protein